MTSQHALEIESGNRFTFGDNWTRFLSGLTEAKIREAMHSLQSMLGVESLEGKSFLDVGSGSGLFSLAAKRLGATVHSFDYDPKSVACTYTLKTTYFPNDPAWVVEEGSVLDKAYLTRLGQFDIVYSWGVLHHTGQMSRAFENIIDCVSPGGALFIAIYNDQGLISGYWSFIKRAYNKGWFSRLTIILLHTPYLIGVRFLVHAFRGKFAFERGMSQWYDMIDWLGGYPFEVRKPEAVFRFFRDHNFMLEELKTRGGMGCNEFVFRRQGGWPVR